MSYIHTNHSTLSINAQARRLRALIESDKLTEDEKHAVNETLIMIGDGALPEINERYPQNANVPDAVSTTEKLGDDGERQHIIPFHAIGKITIERDKKGVIKETRVWATDNDNFTTLNDNFRFVHFHDEVAGATDDRYEQLQIELDARNDAANARDNGTWNGKENYDTWREENEERHRKGFAERARKSIGGAK